MPGINRGDGLYGGTGGGGGGSGDVVGPGSSTDNAIVRYNGTTGKLIQNSGITIDDSDNLLGVVSVTTTQIKATSVAGIDIYNNTGGLCAIIGAGGGTGTSLLGTTNIGSASADYIQISGGTGTSTATATGSSSNININLVPKGTGRLQEGGTNLVKESLTITVNGTAQDLSANRTFTVTDATLSTSDITTNNATSLKHGFLPKLSGSASDVLKGDGTWGASSGLSWGSTINSTSGTGITATISNSSSAGTIAYSGVIGNTQTNACTVIKSDTGTSAVGHTGILVNVYNASTSARGVKVDLSTTGTGKAYEATTANTGGSQLITFQNTSSARRGSLRMYATSGKLLSLGTDDSDNPRGTSIDTLFELATNYGLGDVDLYGIRYADGRYGTISTAQTRSLVIVDHTRSRSNTSGTVADNYNLGYFKRTSITTGAGGTLTSTGSVFKLENVVTQTAGTLTDSAVVLSLVQDNDSTGGHILFNAYSGTPGVNNTLWYDGTNLKYRDNAGTIKTVTAV